MNRKWPSGNSNFCDMLAVGGSGCALPGAHAFGMSRRLEALVGAWPNLTRPERRRHASTPFLQHCTARGLAPHPRGRMTNADVDISSDSAIAGSSEAMRKANVFRHESAIPRMVGDLYSSQQSWSPRNLYNLIARSSTPFLAGQTSFTKTSMTMYQQRFRSKRLLRGYHGDWIPETRFRRWFLPSHLPSFQALPQGKRGKEQEHALDSPVPPVASLFLREVERRLDVVVFRCCFAHSAYHSRSLVVHGKVSVNGQTVTDPNTLLEEGDLISVEPESVPMLNKQAAKRVQQDRESRAPKPPEPKSNSEPEATSKAADAEPASPPAAEEKVETDTKNEEDKSVSEELSNTAEAKPVEGEKEPQQKNEPESTLPPGVLPFNLPPFAAPFLFIPPYLDVSFRTCSAIYMRHPTLTTHLVRRRENGQNKNQPRAQRTFQSDIPTPYPAGGEMFGLAWEFYVRNAPRVRGEERRTKLEGRYGRSGFASARAWERDRRRVAIRRGWGRKRRITLPVSPLSGSSKTAK